MICPNCGKTVHSHNAFCSGCGTRLGRTPEYHHQAADSPRRKKIPRWIIVVGLIFASLAYLVFLAVGAFAFIVFLKTTEVMIGEAKPNPPAITVFADEHANERLKYAQDKYQQDPKGALRQALSIRSQYPAEAYRLIERCREQIIEEFDVGTDTVGYTTEVFPLRYLGNTKDGCNVSAHIYLSGKRYQDPVYRLMIYLEDQSIHPETITLSVWKQTDGLTFDSSDMETERQIGGLDRYYDVLVDRGVMQEFRRLMNSDQPLVLKIPGDRNVEVMITVEQMDDLQMILECYDAIAPEIDESGVGSATPLPPFVSMDPEARKALAEEKSKSAQDNMNDYPMEAILDAFAAKDLNATTEANALIKKCRNAIIQLYDVQKDKVDGGTRLSPREMSDHNFAGYLAQPYIDLPLNGEPFCGMWLDTFNQNPIHPTLFRVRSGDESIDFVVNPADFSADTLDDGTAAESIKIELDATERGRLRSIMNSPEVHFQIMGDQNLDYILTDDQVNDVCMILDCYQAIMPPAEEGSSDGGGNNRGEQGLPAILTPTKEIKRLQDLSNE